MKQTLIKTAVLFFAISISFASCKKDKVEPKNSFKYHEKESLIGSVFAENVGEISVGSYGYYVYFLENTLTVHYTNSAPDGLSGSGDDMLIAMVSSDPSGLKPGVYTYGNNQNTYIPNTFGYDSRLLINHNIANETYSGVLLYGGGTITVTRNGDEYEFNFSMSTTVNSTITGTYKGKIAIFAFAPGKKVPFMNPFAFPNRIK